MNYLQYAIRLANLIPVNTTNTAFQNLLPTIIDYAEQRIYRELNLLSTRVANTSSSCTANSRSFTLPTPAAGPFITVVGLNVVTPVGSTTSNGTRNQVVSRSRMLVDYYANTETAASASSVPKMYYMRDQSTVIFGPAPGAAFNVEVIGTIRPNPLSATNTSTFLTQYLPDLFMAASMTFAGNYLRDFGVEGGNAGAGQMWEQQYKDLAMSANNEETRKRYNDEVNKQ